MPTKTRNFSINKRFQALFEAHGECIMPLDMIDFYADKKENKDFFLELCTTTDENCDIAATYFAQSLATAMKEDEKHCHFFVSVFRCNKGMNVCKEDTNICSSTRHHQKHSMESAIDLLEREFTDEVHPDIHELCVSGLYKFALVCQEMVHVPTSY